MQQTDPISAQVQETAPTTGSRPPHRSLLRSLAFVYYILFALLVLALLPPYISVNRYQHRIAESIGQSLGRPVHLDKVTLNLLPLPGFTIDNLVVTEDPAFGSEPIIRANSVHVTLRVWPLWRRRIEFSSISFTEPSVNLVHLPDGRWNLQSILLQASRIQAAPTAQRTISSAPRFPYIEATGARLNLKLGQEKTPISLTDAEFALWLPNPQQWRIRIEARPARTDANVSDTGIFRLEGTLGRAPSLSLVPISLDAEWRNAPLGGASQLFLGRDANVRGDMTLSAHATGTVGNSSLTTRLRLNALRRADFVPQHPPSVDLQCHSTAANSFHSFPDVQCSWLPDSSSTTQALILTAAFPDIRHLDSATARLTTNRLPLSTVLDWLRAVSTRIPADLTAQGTLIASVEDTSGLGHWHTHWETSLQAEDLTLASPLSGLVPLTLGELNLTSPAATTLQLSPATIPLGGKDPATLEGRIDSHGYTLHLAGMATIPHLLALGKALPPLGDGLKEALPTNRASGPIRIDLTVARPWGGTQTWQEATPHPTPNHHRAR
ncbi:AsmA family protein [Granulicella sp. dw_53]|uniref:AsmA family protein n=1 Tax=Granulicella sp. dw_53 TaxID=2719792 RepID=UPI001BD2CDF8|nr:AsmA family protein [Granulicella sp. dw_53]